VAPRVHYAYTAEDRGGPRRRQRGGAGARRATVMNSENLG